MKTPVFCGSSVAIVTPFTPDGAVNYAKFHELVDMQIAGGTSAIVVCGTTGESATLNDEEHIALVKDCVDYVAGRVKVIAGSGSNDTMHALHLSQACEEAGADALLVVTPYYNKTTQHGLVKHYEYLADRVSIPIIVYSVPSRTGMSASVDALKELSAHPLINGVKDANSNIGGVAATLAACGDELNVWSGNDDETVAMMALGAKGVISVWANIDPRGVSDLTAACLRGDFAEAAALQLKAYGLIKSLFIETNPMPVKTAMNIIGLEVGGVRPPLCEMLPENIEKLRARLLGYGLIK
ncbi:MAG: 4-hydroxy-tetrahydrodipicolinate synthase [Bacteroidales bacterium]|nr:4-hydroxy-tetrahydrodipicolinate synthase [Bacteroidales bacterium]